MQYLEEFLLPSARAEDDFILSDHPLMRMTCYSDRVYPFKIFPDMGLRRITFSPITVFYGGNGSGKSTLLNLIARKCSLRRAAPYNETPFFDAFLERCDAKFCGILPKESRILTSDDVFDDLLDLRSINQGIDHRREELFLEYQKLKKEHFVLQSLEDLEQLRQHNLAKRTTKSDFTNRSLQQNLRTHSNGETAFSLFTGAIEKPALYLLDEPENSLSAPLQQKLADFLSDAVRFSACQLIIATHSPFLLALEGAKIYDLDARPVTVKDWTELENVRLWQSFFELHRNRF